MPSKQSHKVCLTNVILAPGVCVPEGLACRFWLVSAESPESPESGDEFQQKYQYYAEGVVKMKILTLMRVRGTKKLTLVSATLKLLIFETPLR